MEKPKEVKQYSVVLNEAQRVNMKVFLGRTDIKGAESQALLELVFLLDNAQLIEKANEDKTSNK